MTPTVEPKYLGEAIIAVVHAAIAPVVSISEDVVAEGRILKRGKEIIYTDVRVTNEAGKLLAQGTVVYRIVETERG